MSEVRTSAVPVNLAFALVNVTAPAVVYVWENITPSTPGRNWAGPAVVRALLRVVLEPVEPEAGSGSIMPAFEVDGIVMMQSRMRIYIKMDNFFMMKSLLRVFGLRH
jgi:hypothetical protein